MSGGVDSSVAAILLRELGYDPIGVTLKLLPEAIEKTCLGSAGYRVCCSSEAVDDARQVAYRAGIPHYVYDGRERFRRAVVEPFIADYLAGRTPNPCTACNPAVKFALLIEAADVSGAPWVATGHYARIASLDGIPCVRRGVDPAKDQSYMLALLSPAQVARLVLPLGGLTKRESRDRAIEQGLSVADKPDSQDICFIPDGDYRGFLERSAPAGIRPGRIVDTAGNPVGAHDGHIRFTIGQRKGIHANLPYPVFVLRIDPDGTVVVGPDRETFSPAMTVTRWIRQHPAFALPGDYLVQIRSRHEPIAARVAERPEGGLAVEFSKPVRAVTPGQTAAFFKGELLLAGGVIA